MAVRQNISGEPQSANLTGRYVPREVSHIKDYLMWMIVTCPEFDDKSGNTLKERVDTAFDVLNAGLKTVEKRIGGDVLSILLNKSDAARLAFSSGDEDRGFALLNDLNSMRWTGRKKAETSGMSAK